MRITPHLIALAFVPIFIPLALTAQVAREHDIPLKNWDAPLYWQPTQAETRANSSQADLSADLSSQATTTAPSTFIAVTPCRLVDTRASAGFSGSFGPPSLVGGASRTFPILASTACAIPSSALAYSFNVTVVPIVVAGVTPPGYLGFLTIFPTGQPLPNASTLNNYLGTVVANAAIIPAGTNGSVDVFAHDATDLIVDINGYYAPSSGSGVATTISIGATTTGAPGTQASVVNSGSNTTAVLNFTVPQGAAGATGTIGPQGATGPAGTAATIGIGTTTTSAPGSSASVTNSGTVGAALLNFTVPQGAAGPTGPIGPAGPTGLEGPIGLTGVAGTQGAIGPAGTAATVSIGTVATGAPGSSAVVTNTGTVNAALFNFSLPQGVGGPAGVAGPTGLQGLTGPIGPIGPIGPQGLQGPAGASQWTTTGSNIYYNTGNVGIGTLTPGSTLEVAGSLKVSGAANGIIFPDGRTQSTAMFTSATLSSTAAGISAMANSTGSLNSAFGYQALQSNVAGASNTALGANALNQNVAGNNNTALGSVAGYNILGNSNIMIGNQGLSTDDHFIRIGDVQTQTFIAGIAGVNVSGVPVLVSSSGQLGIASSSRRYKEDIQDMGDATANLMRLRPVTFRYKKPFDDGSQPMQYGLIAEEVEEVYPDLVAHSADGRIETVKYQVLDSMLLNEVQRLNAQNTAQQDEIRALQQRLSKLESLISQK